MDEDPIGGGGEGMGFLTGPYNGDRKILALPGVQSIQLILMLVGRRHGPA